MRPGIRLKGNRNPPQGFAASMRPRPCGPGYNGESAFDRINEIRLQ